MPAFAARTQFAKVFIEIDSRRVASDTPTPSVIAGLTASLRDSFVYTALGIRFINANISLVSRNVGVHFFQPASVRLYDSLKTAPRIFQPSLGSDSSSASTLDLGKRFSARKSTKTRTFGATKRLEGHTARKVPTCFVNSSKTTISLPSVICWRM